jgi:hypothetical protein
LHSFGGSDTNLGVHRNTDKTETLGVLPQVAWFDATIAKTFGVIVMQSDATADGLRDTNEVHVAEEENCFQTADVDTFCEDGVVKNNKLLVVVLTPGR